MISCYSSKRQLLLYLRKGTALVAKLKAKEMYEEDEDFPNDEEAPQQFAILMPMHFLTYILSMSVCTPIYIHHISFHMCLRFPMMVSSCQVS